MLLEHYDLNRRRVVILKKYFFRVRVGYEA